MYLRKCRHKVGEEQKDYWQLVESYRTERGPRQRVVAYLGDLDEAGRIGMREAASGNSGRGRGVNGRPHVHHQWSGHVHHLKSLRAAAEI